MDKRELAKKLYLNSGIEDNAYNWHIWKRAFDLGWDNTTNENEALPLQSFNGCNLSIEEIQVTVSVILTAKKYTNKRIAGYVRMEKLENKLTAEIKNHYNR